MEVGDLPAVCVLVCWTAAFAVLFVVPAGGGQKAAELEKPLSLFLVAVD